MSSQATEPERARRRLVIAGLIAVALALIAAPFIRDALWRRPRAFDAEVWRDEASNVNGRSARHGMADELRDRLLRDRPTRSELHELLGTPCFTVSGNDWWTLGMSPGLMVTDDCGLQVDYGEDERLLSALLAHQSE